MREYRKSFGARRKTPKIARIHNKKGRTPLQRPAPNNQTNQPLTSELQLDGKTKNPSSLISEACYSDSYFGQMFNPFFKIFCNRCRAYPPSVPFCPCFTRLLACFLACKKTLFEGLF